MLNKTSRPSAPRRQATPGIAASIVPVLWLFACVLIIILTRGGGAVLDAAKWVMLSSAVIALLIARWGYRRRTRHVLMGLRRSWRQLSPAMVVLVFIGMVATMWMLSGVVPTLIHYGLQLLNPRYFLLTSCAICSMVSVFTGSSWTTIATIGVALQGIGTVFGYHDGWIAGAIISGAYFGDKVSPLSDTTVLASTSCGVPLLTHVRYMLWSTVPAMAIALAAYTAAGLLAAPGGANQSGEILAALHGTFSITPLTLLIPLVTGILIARRVNTNVTLAISTLMGVAGLVVWQPQVLAGIVGGMGMSHDAWGVACAIGKTLAVGAEMHTGSPLLDTLSTTRGIAGMWDTFTLVFCAMIFGGVMMGTGMLGAITGAITRRLCGVRRVVAATVGTGLLLNSCTADQYLSIILNGNVYKNLYRRQRLEGRLLSRTVEDSTSVTSVLIPWNSCGMTQSSVLGVPTLTYLPYCIFNVASPLMTLALAFTGVSITRRLRRKAVPCLQQA